MRKFEKNRKLKDSQTRKIRVLFLFLIFILLGFLAFLIFRVLTLDKFIYVNRTGTGDGEIVVMNSESNVISKYLIPADTELVSTRGFGKYRLSSLWVLNEKNEGLVTETITKNFFLPVVLWNDQDRGNLNIYQKIKIFMSSVKKIDPDKTLELDSVSNSVYVQFIDPNLIDFVPMISIQDLTGTVDTADDVSKIIETTGGKISSNLKGYDEDFDCEISGINKEILDIFSRIFNCEITTAALTTEDINIKLGAKFSDRF